MTTVNPAGALPATLASQDGQHALQAFSTELQSMIPDQLRELEALITARRQALGSEALEDVARARDESYVAVAGTVTDSADEAAADLLSDLDQAEVSRDLREIRDLEAAQQRIADGTYGVCTDCGNDIGYERLRAYPTAVRCIRCQGVYEKTHLQPGGPRL